MRFISLLFATLMFNFLLAQENGLEIGVSQDSILAGNKFEVSYTLKNVNAQIKELPDLGEFQILSGPNQSSQMSFVNGEMSSEVSLSFILIAPIEGVFEIPVPLLETKEEGLAFEKKYIVILPNPDNIQEPLFDGKPKEPIVPQKKKTKRKLYRI